MGIGQVVATGYSNEDAQEHQRNIDQLNEQLDQLEYAKDATPGADMSDLESQLSKDIIDFAKQVAKGDMGGGLENEDAIKGAVVRLHADSDDLLAVDGQISLIKSQLETLMRQSSSNSSPILAPCSGHFSGTVDGFEEILAPSELGSITVSELENMTPAPIANTAFSRLIVSPMWYYVTVVPSEYIADLVIGDSVRVTFSNNFTEPLNMDISRKGEDENGQSILVVESSNYMHQMCVLREQSADIMFDIKKGLRVPKSALYMNQESKPGVYILESTTAKWKSVEILYDTGESYVVKLDDSNTDNLWAGDELIVGADDLFDGKVVRK